MSGGERQRLAMARIFLRDPDLVVLDEPTASLVMEAERDMLSTISLLCQGRTAIIVSHRLKPLSLATHALILERGESIFFGTCQEAWRMRADLRHLLPPEWADSKLGLTLDTNTQIG